MLLLATFFWGTSFLTMKALVMVQQQLSPNSSTWFLTSLSLVFRFGGAALILVIWNWRRLRQMTRLEFIEGFGLGTIGGVGLLFQMDGVNYTPASTSAFLTQCYCLFIPVFLAVRQKKWPSKMVMISSGMVLAGVAILSGFNFTKAHLGRGEWETLIASLFFTVQILWLERKAFVKNDASNFTLVMFAVIALIFFPIAIMQGSFREIAVVYSAPSTIVFSLILMVLCTLVSYGIMNHWQRHVPATHAGLIYCSEPVFTSVFAIFLPGWFSLLAKINYPNEVISLLLLVGGGLIIAANVLIFTQNADKKSSG